MKRKKPIITVKPAYGRDYSNPHSACDDWNAGVDFQIMDIGCEYNGRYISIRDEQPVLIKFGPNFFQWASPVFSHEEYLDD